MQKWGVLVLLVLVLVLLWRARPRPRVPRPVVEPGFYDELQNRAGQIARAVFELALRRLTVPAEIEELVAAASQLARRLAELRSAEHDDAGPRAAWERASLLVRTRHPALYRFAMDMDLPALERLASSESGAVPTLVREELDNLRGELRAALGQLASEPETVWGDLELLVLALVVRNSNPEEEMAAALRAGGYARRNKTNHDFVSRRKLAGELIHGTPPSDRVEQEGVPALPTADPKLGAALVRFHQNAAAQQSELERAWALVAGETKLFFLAEAIVHTVGYPEPSLEVWQRLRPLAEKALAGDDASRAAFTTQARVDLGNRPAEEMIAHLPGAHP